MNSVTEILEGYRAQRRHREAKRNEFMRRFDVLRGTFAHPASHQPAPALPKQAALVAPEAPKNAPQRANPVNQGSASEEEHRLMAENEQLKKEVGVG